MMQFELTPEQKQLKETARRFAADEIIPVAAKYDEEQTFAADVVRKAWELGLMNAEPPEGLIRISELTIPPSRG
jgi:acyl-CoA dehydrogenase